MSLGKKRWSCDEVGEEELLRALRDHGWGLAPAAKALGVSRTSLYAMIERSSKVRKAVDLSATSALDATVDYTVTGTATGADYTLADGTLTINAGATTNNITIAAIGVTPFTKDGYQIRVATPQVSQVIEKTKMVRGE